MTQADCHSGEIAVRIKAIGMNAGQELVDSQTRGQGVDADHGRTILWDAPDVAFLETLLVLVWADVIFV